MAGASLLALLDDIASILDDVAAMTKVVEVVHQARRDDLEPTAGDDHWRRKLMSIGHDPLKPPRSPT